MKPCEEYCLHTHRWVMLDGGKCSREDVCAETDGRFLCPWNMVETMRRQEDLSDESARASNVSKD